MRTDILTNSRVPWSHSQSVVACGLYFTLPFGQMHSRNPIIIEIAGLLGRTPSSLAMKLVNFASLDPEQQARGIRGLSSHSRTDEQVWKEFSSDWEGMTLLSEASLQALQSGRPFNSCPDTVVSVLDANIRTEVELTVKARRMQGVFRKLVLAAYESRCCITGNPIPDLLVASHILPWADFPKERLNPRNGVCLSAHFDRAFDRGLISFDDQIRLTLSPLLRRYLPNDSIESEFVRREGQPLKGPERFAPDPSFFAYHRKSIFRLQ